MLILIIIIRLKKRMIKIINIIKIIIIRRYNDKLIIINKI